MAHLDSTIRRLYSYIQYIGLGKFAKLISTLQNMQDLNLDHPWSLNQKLLLLFLLPDIPWNHDTNILSLGNPTANSLLICALSTLTLHKYTVIPHDTLRYTYCIDTASVLCITPVAVQSMPGGWAAYVIPHWRILGVSRTSLLVWAPCACGGGVPYGVHSHHSGCLVSVYHSFTHWLLTNPT